MRAAIYNGQKNILLSELPTPVAGDNDIVVRNIFSASAERMWQCTSTAPNTGHRVTLGGGFGHEMVSEVVEVGKNVKGLHLGIGYIPAPRLAKGDTKRAGTVGGFSEYVLIPNVKLNKQVYDIPDQISS